MPLKVLVIGYGSIGKKHARNLSELGIRPFIMTSHPDSSPDCRFIRTIGECPDPDYAIIATPTSGHAGDLKSLADGTICKNILIEKPAGNSLKEGMTIKKMASRHKMTVSIAYNMRFLGIFDDIMAFLEKNTGKIDLVKITAGQYLPEWRPASDYRISYSAQREMGGGADLDLSHEIDYMLRLFGKPEKTVLAYNDNISGLDVRSPDYFKGIYRYPEFVADVELDYFRKKERTLRILGDNRCLADIDFINGRAVMDGQLSENASLFDFKKSYLDELREFLGMAPRRSLASLDEGIEVLKLLNPGYHS